MRIGQEEHVEAVVCREKFVGQNRFDKDLEIGGTELIRHQQERFGRSCCPEDAVVVFVGSQKTQQVFFAGGVNVVEKGPEDAFLHVWNVDGLAICIIVADAVVIVVQGQFQEWSGTNREHTFVGPKDRLVHEKGNVRKFLRPKEMSPHIFVIVRRTAIVLLFVLLVWVPNGGVLQWWRRRRR